jgi:hypothetical protein
VCKPAGSAQVGAAPVCRARTPPPPQCMSCAPSQTARSPSAAHFSSYRRFQNLQSMKRKRAHSQVCPAPAHPVFPRRARLHPRAFPPSSPLARVKEERAVGPLRPSPPHTHAHDQTHPLCVRTPWMCTVRTPRRGRRRSGYDRCTHGDRPPPPHTLQHPSAAPCHPALRFEGPQQLAWRGHVCARHAHTHARWGALHIHPRPHGHRGLRDRGAGASCIRTTIAARTRWRGGGGVWRGRCEWPLTHNAQRTTASHFNATGCPPPRPAPGSAPRCVRLACAQESRARWVGGRFAASPPVARPFDPEVRSLGVGVPYQPPPSPDAVFRSGAGKPSEFLAGQFVRFFSKRRTFAA